MAEYSEMRDKINEFGRLLETLPNHYDELVTELTDRLLEICWKYAYMGSYFTFQGIRGLPKQIEDLVNYIIEDILSDIESYYNRTLRICDAVDDDNSIWFLVTNLQNLPVRTRITERTNYLMKVLEATLAIAFSQKLTLAKTRLKIIDMIKGNKALALRKYLNNPDFKCEILNISNPDAPVRIGTRSWLKSIIIIMKDILQNAYQQGTREHFILRKAIGYRVFRGSNYPCERCQSLTDKIYPIDVWVLPEHINCMCFAVPIYYEGQVIEW